MNNKLFVGSLDFGLTDQDLQEFFSQYGEIVSAKVITDRETGRSRGFGFVEFADEAAANAALAANGQVLGEKGRQIKVMIAEPMKPRAPQQNNW